MEARFERWMHLRGVEEPGKTECYAYRETDGPPARDHQAEHDHPHEEQIRHGQLVIGNERGRSEDDLQGSVRPGLVQASVGRL